MFKLLNIQLVHGWLVDPQDKELHDILKDLTYNQAQDLCLKDGKEGEIVKSFFDSNPSQLTIYGLMKIQNELKEGELCVFFRNNHFSVIVKYNNELYTLVTDMGYFHEKEVVWEKFIDLTETVYCKGDFKKFIPRPREKKREKEVEDDCLIL